MITASSSSTRSGVQKRCARPARARPSGPPTSLLRRRGERLGPGRDDPLAGAGRDVGPGGRAPARRPGGQRLRPRRLRHRLAAAQTRNGDRGSVGTGSLVRRVVAAGSAASGLLPSRSRRRLVARAVGAARAVRPAARGARCRVVILLVLVLVAASRRSSPSAPSVDSSLAEAGGVPIGAKGENCSSGVPRSAAFMNACQIEPGSVRAEHRAPVRVRDRLALCRCRPTPPSTRDGV